MKRYIRSTSNPELYVVYYDDGKQYRHADPHIYLTKPSGSKRSLERDAAKFTREAALDRIHSDKWRLIRV